jgi:hypothetical protein
LPIVSLSDYINDYVGKSVDKFSLANETFYMFGDLTMSEWQSLLERYELPPFGVSSERLALSFGIGAHQSGVQWHVHGQVWAETIYGAKRWFLLPPHQPPTFDPDRSSLQWLVDEFATSPLRDSIVRCTLSDGELLWIPDQWWHLTLNIGETVFISSFV